MRTLLGLGVVGICCSVGVAGASTTASNGLIAFVRGSQIWVANPDGSEQHQLTSSGETDYFNAWPAWSRDGHKIAFHSEISRGISTMNADGSDVRIVTDNRGVIDVVDNEPTWGPDGRIGFVRTWSDAGVGHHDVFVVNADGSDLRQVTRTSLVESELEWSPDGRYFTFAGFRRGAPGALYLIRADGSRLRRLTTPKGGSDTEPAWSPDSGRIVFTRISRPRGRYCFRVLVIRRDGSGLRVVRNDCPLPSSQPAWSPDGRKIVYLGFWPRKPTGRNQLLTTTPDGKSTSPFRTRIYGDDPDWQPLP